MVQTFIKEASYGIGVSKAMLSAAHARKEMRRLRTCWWRQGLRMTPWRSSEPCFVPTLVDFRSHRRSCSCCSIRGAGGSGHLRAERAWQDVAGILSRYVKRWQLLPCRRLHSGRDVQDQLLTLAAQKSQLIAQVLLIVSTGSLGFWGLVENCHRKHVLYYGPKEDIDIPNVNCSHMFLDEAYSKDNPRKSQSPQTATPSIAERGRHRRGGGVDWEMIPPTFFVMASSVPRLHALQGPRNWCFRSQQLTSEWFLACVRP